MSTSLAGTWGSERLKFKDPIDVELRSYTVMKVSIKILLLLLLLLHIIYY